MPNPEGSKHYPKLLVRSPQTGLLLFKFIPELDIIEIAQRGIVDTIKLADYRNVPSGVQFTSDTNKA